ncbi:MAG: hypothetical protein GC151_17580 [Betaproteobacteria bacterium]|nr:hypothetical protein [Betaproteobacteria bacterium]
MARGIQDGSGNPVGTGAGGNVASNLDKANATSPAADRAETELSLDEILKQLTDACTTSARQLQIAMEQPEWRDSPVIYTIPGMKVNVKVGLTATKERVKGILWWRTQQGTTTEALSQIEMDIVAVPRTPGGAGS